MRAAQFETAFGTSFGTSLDSRFDTSFTPQCAFKCLALRWISAIIMCLLAMIGSVQAQSAGSASSEPNDWWGDSIWNNPSRDYKWYPPDPVAPAPVVPEKKPVAKELTKPKKLADFTSTQAIKKHLEQLREVAILKPTESNVREYFTFQIQVLDQSSTFQDVARRVIWTNPEIDYSTRRPVNSAATLEFNQSRITKVRQSSANLAKTHGLLFFFRSDCPYCHQMTSVIQSFAQESKMEILPISLDGRAIPGLKDVQVNRGLAQQLQVTTVPAVFLVERKTKAIQAIGFGVMALSDLVDRIHVITQTKPGEEY